MQNHLPTEYVCPSCATPEDEPCITTGHLTGCCHEVRHRLADAANWAELAREIPISTNWTIGR